MADTKDFTEANRKYWDSMAATYNKSPWQIGLQSKISEFIRQNTEFIGLAAGDGKDGAKLLDYACGTGMISMALQPHVASTTGIDLSPSMVARFNEALPSIFPSTASVHAIEENLLSPSPSLELEKPELYEFDIAAVGLGFHHFADPQIAMQKLVQRVKKGTGVVMIVDWLPQAKPGKGGEEHSHGHGHGHEQHNGPAHGRHPDPMRKGAETTIRTNGFGEEDMRELFKGAGCGNFRFRTLEERVVLYMGEEGRRVEKTVFLARGTRGSN